MSQSLENRARKQQPIAGSGTYTALQAIRRWVESQESDDLARLLEIGDVRTPDLLAACRNPEDEIAGATFLALLLLGKPECETCANSASEMHGLPAVCSATLSEAGFKRIELWLARKRTATGYACGENYEPSTPMGDWVVYALILDGSSRSRSILDRLLAFEKTCATGPTIVGDILEQARSWRDAAQHVGHNLRVEPDKLEDSVRASAFFLPQKFRKDSKIEVIYKNKAGNRILLEVSYLCGRLCGSGYYVVLRKDGADWHYALITMAWVS